MSALLSCSSSGGQICVLLHVALDTPFTRTMQFAATGIAIRVHPYWEYASSALLLAVADLPHPAQSLLLCTS